MEEIKKIEVQGQQYGVADMLMREAISGLFGDSSRVIEWSHEHSMNDYKEAGTYRIKGERTGNPMDDNLPIMNSGSGHTIEGLLYVLDSSLTNGSGENTDCTVTQFLMLSNRVGGQEGDMYMRSAYGVNKDNLTWKPWEKYQTNMEVGVVTDAYTVNPQNPTQIINHVYGMKELIDNGIYSGVYIGPKTMIGTSEDPNTIIFQDPSAIETFVMVAINNYDAAKDAKCITQIKFAVTNGGVFSMEKRSTIPGTTTDWSQWESIGGGSTNMYWNKDYQDLIIENPNIVNNSITMSSRTTINTEDGAINLSCGDVRHAKLYGWNEIGIYSQLGPWAKIGGGANIGDDVNIQGVVIENENEPGEFTIRKSGIYDVGLEVCAPQQMGVIVLGGQSTSISGKYVTTYLDWGSKISYNASIGHDVTIPDNLKFSIADNILTITDGTNTWKLTAEA